MILITMCIGSLIGCLIPVIIFLLSIAMKYLLSCILCPISGFDVIKIIGRGRKCLKMIPNGGIVGCFSGLLYYAFGK